MQTMELNVTTLIFFRRMNNYEETGYSNPFVGCNAALTCGMRSE
jgi:hypothetical protein